MEKRFVLSKTGNAFHCLKGTTTRTMLLIKRNYIVRLLIIERRMQQILVYT